MQPNLAYLPCDIVAKPKNASSNIVSPQIPSLRSTIPDRPGLDRVHTSTTCGKALLAMLQLTNQLFRDSLRSWRFEALPG